MAMRGIMFLCALAATLILAGCATTSTTSAAKGGSPPASTAASTPPTTAPTSSAPTSTSPTAPPTTASPSSPPAPPPPPPVTTTKSISPAGVVEAYFAAINAGEYSQAWALGGDNLGQSYAQFAAGFAGTAEDSVEIVAVHGDTVTVDLTANNNDGSQQTFAGTYTVRGNQITGASVVQTGPVASPLCGAPANPFGYNFCGQGGLIYSPAAGICNYFDCIDNFPNGHGYMVECNDGHFSMSGGQGDEVCSYNGGVEQNVYGG